MCVALDSIATNLAACLDSKNRLTIVYPHVVFDFLTHRKIRRIRTSDCDGVPPAFGDARNHDSAAENTRPEMSEPSELVPSRLNLSPAVPIFRVENLDASVAYYEDRLGFQLQWRADPLASVGRDRTSIMLSEADQGHPGTWVWIAADDVDELYAELRARGAYLRHPPTNYPWGSRECQVTDLDQHVLRFGTESDPGESLGPWLDGKGRLWRPQADGSWRIAD